MTKTATTCLLSVACAAALLSGCAVEVEQGNKHELHGEYHLAYEEYLNALRRNPGDSAATSGLRRTVNLAASYWEAQAFGAAADGQWDQSAEYHLKVLQIKPNERSSVLSLRQIARRDSRPDVALASNASSADEEPSDTVQEPQIAFSAHASQDISDDDQTSESEPFASVADDARKSSGLLSLLRVIGDHKARPRPNDVVTPAPLPQQAQTLVMTVAEPVAASDGPSRRLLRPAVFELAAEPVYVGSPPSDQIDFTRAKPVSPRPRPKLTAKPRPAAKPQPASTAPKPTQAPKSKFTNTVRLSFSDERYTGTVHFDNGLSVELRDTDTSPVDADLRIHLNNEFLSSHKDLQEGSIVIARDKSGASWEIGIVQVLDATQTVVIGIRKSSVHPVAEKNLKTPNKKFAKIIRLSLEDKRYPRTVYFDNGLAIELGDTDICPIDADLRIHLNDKFLSSHMDLQEGSIVVARDKFATPYEIGIVQILDTNQTVVIGVRRQ